LVCAAHRAVSRCRIPAAAAFLAGFLDEMKRSGFVAGVMKGHRTEGALVAPVETP